VGLLLVIAALLLAGCGDQETELPAAAGMTTFTDERLGLEVTFPSDWQRAQESLTPALTDPREILSLGTVTPVANGEGVNCAQHAEATLARLGPRDAFVTVQERANATSSEMVEGPPRLAAVEPDDSEAPGCLQRDVPFETYWMPFRSGGRGLYAMAAIGDEADPGPVQAVLGSLRLRPRQVEDDRQRGIRFSYGNPWRLYPSQLTQAVELRHQIALGTFPLEQAEPDPNCRPETMLRGRGDGGALFVFEYADIGETQLERFPLRPARFSVAEHDPQAYECFDESHLIRWRERNGRAFQAHLYGSTRWVEQALGILDTFDVWLE
jgi:hypothetical protein